VLDLVRGHAAVERVRHSELDVLDAPAGRELDHLLEHELADVGGLHRRQRDRDVVDRDRESHAGLQKLPQWLGAVGVVERVPDVIAQPAEPGERVRRVDHPRAERELLEPEPLALVDQERRRAFVDLEDETRSCHVVVSPS
jgi:hypothetical protein